MDLSHKDSPKPVMYFVNQAIEEINSKNIQARKIRSEDIEEDVLSKIKSMLEKR
jgi:hypothetical protein